ncbi:hypothetical protein NIES267_10920 [Calothrix parasitica NIES-267]|uniref:Uncharacterized protein n=1 Tax=Calothrix parasitica NIES-267 TaxID=1973488 RepID=A0A1Z4LK78_9CYAN|nr:hypothetical protein NIES267_10920 [Calothrix parasitica NIES-267]
MKNIINPQKALLAALISTSPLLLLSTPSSAAIRNYTAYRSFDSCGSVQRTKSEARSAARKKVRQLNKRGYRATLKNFNIVSNSVSRRIVGNSSSTTQTCTTSIVVRVVVDVQR